jgi:hypothetical protein
VNPILGLTKQSVRSAHFWAKLHLDGIAPLKGENPLPPLKIFHFREKNLIFNFNVAIKNL